jgi:carbamoyltransferase
MKILSIGWNECSTAALMVDGEVVACISEERFSRIKNDERYPLRAIDAVLKRGGVTPADLDHVVFAANRFDAKAVLVHKYSGFSAQDRLREQKEYWYPRMYEQKDVRYLDVFEDRIDTGQFGAEWDKALEFLRSDRQAGEDEFFREFRRKTAAKHLGLSPDKIEFADHHRGHGYYAYYGSPVPKDRAVILTADAWGDDKNASVSVAEGGHIELLCSTNNCQLARLYRSMTLLLGMKPDEHEYKVMGLAAYARPDSFQQAYRVFKETQYVEGLSFAYRQRPTDLYVYFRDRLEGCRFDAVAGALQRYTEEMLVEWAEHALKAAGVGSLVFGGGVAMNVKAMMQIAKLPQVEHLFVCPAPSDESLAIGSAYVLLHDLLRSQGKDPAASLKPLANAYLGTEASSADVKDVVREFEGDPGYLVKTDVHSQYLAEQLAEGKIIGRCVGRSEFGPRALGNRSILADPRRSDVIRQINEGVKSRDFWMPFAVTLLAERADDYLLGRKGMAAPYMTLAFETTELARHDLIAGLHPADLTSRPQILERRHNPGYYDLIAEFERRTGVGGLLNTSFNLHGEPIVQTPTDAARVFRASGLDLLVLDGYVIEKRSTKQTRKQAQ